MTEGKRRTEPGGSVREVMYYVTSRKLRECTRARETDRTVSAGAVDG